MKTVEYEHKPVIAYLITSDGIKAIAYPPGTTYVYFYEEIRPKPSWEAFLPGAEPIRIEARKYICDVAVYDGGIRWLERR